MAVTLNASVSSGFIATSDTSGSLELQANGTTKATVGSTGLSIGQYNPAASLITSGTAVNSTSGTAIDFTGIPSWVKRITVMLNGVSTNGASDYRIQIGSGSVDTTGYTGYGKRLSTTGVGSSAQITNGLALTISTSATFPYIGTAVLTLVSGNNWVAQSIIGQTNNDDLSFGTTSKSLSGSLDRVRITTVNGTDTFDAGTINILYE